MSRATDHYIAYVDEAGDEGFGKLRDPDNGGQSRWLALGASIVSAENDRFVPSWRDEIMASFPNKRLRDLHFRYLNHDQRVAACTILAEKPIGACVVLSNKATLLDSAKKEIFKRKGHLYQYLVRFLLERVTAACRDASATRTGNQPRLTVFFSRRAGTDYQAMRDYLELMRDGREVVRPLRSIDWSVLDPSDIKVENHSMRAGLQIADVITSATTSALEPNRYGHCEPRYGTILRRRFLSAKGTRLNCGLTLIPRYGEGPLTSDQKAFIESMM